MSQEGHEQLCLRPFSAALTEHLSSFLKSRDSGAWGDLEHSMGVCLLVLCSVSQQQKAEGQLTSKASPPSP